MTLARRDGGNLASVLGRLERDGPGLKSRIEEYLSKVVPRIRGVEARPVGPKETIVFRQEVGGSKQPWHFFAANMSDGTLRALGVLAALLQSSNGQELERAVELAARQVGRQGGILVVIDSDDDCPAELGPQLLDRARKTRSDLRIGVVPAKREFEGWFLASAESLRGKRGLPDDLAPPPDPESIRGAKEWMARHITGGGTYSETLDQPALTAVFDLDQAAVRSDSFEKCLRESTGLILKLKPINPGSA